jgi:hypothetical protein
MRSGVVNEVELATNQNLAPEIVTWSRDFGPLCWHSSPMISSHIKPRNPPHDKYKKEVHKKPLYNF